MKKIVVWGTGNTARNFLNTKGYCRDFEIVALTDNDGGKIKGYRIIKPFELKRIDYDYVLICSLSHKEIQKQLIEDLLVEPGKIITSFEFEENIRNKVIEKYKSVQEKEIQKVVDYFETRINVYGSYECEYNLQMIHRDEENHPYIIFEDKRMYYPDTYPFRMRDGKEYVGDVFFEQKYKESPHSYVRREEEIKENSIIVDAGVCEGNFSLHYIDRAKKVYLIESDQEWIPALQRTFRPYRDKVVLHHKFLSRYNSVNTATLDSLVNEKIDFLKMDIEGAEIDALLGAKGTLQQSGIRCAVCSYHKQNDEENIKFILRNYGYRTSTSHGYMFFIYDENILDTLDLRRGVVYGENLGEMQE